MKDALHLPKACTSGTGVCAVHIKALVGLWPTIAHRRCPSNARVCRCHQIFSLTLCGLTHALTFCCVHVKAPGGRRSLHEDTLFATYSRAAVWGAGVELAASDCALVAELLLPPPLLPVMVMSAQFLCAEDRLVLCTAAVMLWDLGSGVCTPGRH